MIFFQNGLRTSEMHTPREYNTTDFEFLAYMAKDTQYQTVEATFPNGKEGKPVSDDIKASRKCVYFFPGLLYEGTKRSDNNTKARSLLVLDLEQEWEKDPHTGRMVKARESLPVETAIHTVQEALKGYKYIIYPSINCEPDHARLRVILEPTKAMGKEENIATLTAISKMIPLHCDLQTSDFSRVQGMPVDNGLLDDYHKYIKVNREGKAFKVIDSSESYQNQPVAVGNDSSTPEQGDIFSGRSSLILTDDELANIGEDVIEGSRNTKMTSWMGKLFTMNLNPEAVLSNAERLNDKYMTPKLPHREVESIWLSIKKKEGKRLYLKDNTARVKNTSDLINVLQLAGEKWKKANAREDGSCSPMPTETAVSILKKNVIFKEIISPMGTEGTGTLAYYDPSSGLYETAPKKRQKLYRAVSGYGKREFADLDSKLMTDSEAVPVTANPQFVPCANGIYNDETEELMPFSPKYVFTSKIATRFNPEAQEPEITYFDNDGIEKTFHLRDFLYQLARGDDEMVRLLWQVLNEACHPNSTRERAIFLIGKGDSGKGTFQELIKQLVGESNTSTLKPNQFDGFSLSTLVGKAVNIGDDFNPNELRFKNSNASSNIMSIITGDAVTIDEKFVTPYSMSLTPLLVFSGNEMLESTNKTTGWLRRLLIVPFEASFPKEERNPAIKSQYVKNKGLLEYVLKIALRYKFKHFSIPQSVSKAVEHYSMANDWMREFVYEAFITGDMHGLAAIPWPIVRERLNTFKQQEIGKQANQQDYNHLCTVLKEMTGIPYQRNVTAAYSRETQDRYDQRVYKDWFENKRRYNPKSVGANGVVRVKSLVAPREYFK